MSYGLGGSSTAAGSGLLLTLEGDASLRALSCEGSELRSHEQSGAKTDLKPRFSNRAMISPTSLFVVLSQARHVDGIFITHPRWTHVGPS